MYNLCSYSIDAIMSQASDGQVKKVKEWQEKYQEMDKWYKKMTPKVEGSFNMGKSLPIVRKQIADLEVKSARYRNVQQ